MSRTTTPHCPAPTCDALRIGAGLSFEETDMKPVARIQWGYRAGYRAWFKGKAQADNPFEWTRWMPEMHDSWKRGLRDAELASKGGAA